MKKFVNARKITTKMSACPGIHLATSSWGEKYFGKKCTIQAPVPPATLKTHTHVQPRSNPKAPPSLLHIAVPPEKISQKKSITSPHAGRAINTEKRKPQGISSSGSSPSKNMFSAGQAERSPQKRGLCAQGKLVAILVVVVALGWHQAAAVLRARKNRWGGCHGVATPPPPRGNSPGCPGAVVCPPPHHPACRGAEGGARARN